MPQPEPGHAATERTKKSFFSRFFHLFSRSASIRITPEMRSRLNTPAQLYVWLPNGEAEGGRIFGTLREAIAHIPDDTAVRAFIVTESGHILRPAQIARLKQFLKTAD